MKPSIPYSNSVLAALLLSALCTLWSSAQETVPAPPAPESPTGEASTATTEGDDKAAFDAKLKAIIAELSSDDFRTREEATVKLWKIGDRAEDAVRKLAKGGDIELRTRAARLLGLYKYGIYPDTPPETLELINQFRHGDLNEKTIALQLLYQAGSTAAVTKLVRSIEDQQLRSRLVNTVVSSLDDKIAELLEAEKYDDIEGLLTLAAISDEGLRNLAAFHLHRSSLDQQIAALLKKDKAGEITAIEYEQLTWFFRAKGDFESALAAANASENEELITSTRIAQGDLIAFIKSSYNPNDRTIQTYGFNAALQRLNGELEAFEKTIATIKQYAQDNPEEERPCLDALLINGRITDAIEIAELGSPSRTQLLIDNGEHVRALAELGIKNPKLPYDEWLDGLVAKFESGETANPIREVYTVVRLLKGWGEDAEAARIYRRLGEAASEHDPDSLSRIIANASVLDLPDIALDFTRRAFKIEAEDAAPDPELEGIELEQAHEQNLIGQRDAEDSLISALYFNNSQTAAFWWDRLRKKFTEETSLQLLDRLGVLLSYDPEKKPAILELLTQLVPETENEGVDRDELLRYNQLNFAEIYFRLEEKATAMEWLKKSLEADEESNATSYHYYASLIAAEDQWAEAVPHFKAAAEASPSDPYYQIRYGISLERSGQAEEAARIINRAQLIALGRPDEISRIASAFSNAGEYPRGREASQRVLNLALIEEPAALGEALDLADYLSIDNPERAAMYKERYLVECLKGHISLPSITNAPSIRGSIGSLKARAAVDAGRPDEAVAMLRELVAQQPSNSSLVEDLYPILVLAGKAAEANELYQKLNEYGENALGMFPNSAQDLNSNAWLKSRCGRDLDVALERSKRSNELSKNNYAYLDTLAEVHFQRGERSEAVAKSEEAVKLSGRDFLLDQQLQHFKNDKPLSETLPKADGS